MVGLSPVRGGSATGNGDPRTGLPLTGLSKIVPIVPFGFRRQASVTGGHMRAKHTAMTFTGGVACLWLWGCGSGGSRGPAAPSSYVSSMGTTPLTVAMAESPQGSIFGAGAINFALCLGASNAPACFSANRFRTHSTSTVVTAPAAPTGLSAIVIGNSVTLSWSAPTSGDAVLSYFIEAGSLVGAVNLANI